MDSRLIMGAPLLFFIALLQNAALFSLYGVRINVALLVLGAYAFLRVSWHDYGLLILIVLLGFFPALGFQLSLFAFLVAASVVYGMRHALPFTPFISFHGALIAGLATLYLILDWHFIITTPVLFAEEVVYTMVCGTLLYAFALRDYAKRPRNSF